MIRWAIAATALLCASPAPPPTVHAFDSGAWRTAPFQYAISIPQSPTLPNAVRISTHVYTRTRRSSHNSGHVTGWITGGFVCNSSGCNAVDHYQVDIVTPTSSQMIYRAKVTLPGYFQGLNPGVSHDEDYRVRKTGGSALISDPGFLSLFHGSGSAVLVIDARYFGTVQTSGSAITHSTIPAVAVRGTVEIL